MRQMCVPKVSKFSLLLHRNNARTATRVKCNKEDYISNCLSTKAVIGFQKFLSKINVFFFFPVGMALQEMSMYQATNSKSWMSWQMNCLSTC